MVAFFLSLWVLSLLRRVTESWIFYAFWLVPAALYAFKIQDRKPEPKQVPHATVAAVYVLGIALLSFAADRMPSGPDGTAAQWACESAVDAQLKAPSTAKHGGGQATIKFTEGKFWVSSWVDAQNSFGAMIRTPYICVYDPATRDARVMMQK